MNIAIIIAGGSGRRMNQDIPKQFISIFDKPVIIYTLEAFESHPAIDKIVVVCLDGWAEILSAYAKQFKISKLVKIVPGGDTGQSSIYSGISSLKDIAKENDVILIHDANRPLVSHDIISSCIEVTNNFGNACAVIPCTEAILKTTDILSSNENIPRDELKRTQTPQAVKYKDFIKLHNEAKSKGILNSVATCTLLIELGKTVHYSLGSEKNIRLTTVEDIDIFKALLSVKADNWLKK